MKVHLEIFLTGNILACWLVCPNHLECECYKSPESTQPLELNWIGFIIKFFLWRICDGFPTWGCLPQRSPLTWPVGSGSSSCCGPSSSPPGTLSLQGTWPLRYFEHRPPQASAFSWYEVQWKHGASLFGDEVSIKNVSCTSKNFSFSTVYLVVHHLTSFQENTHFWWSHSCGCYSYWFFSMAATRTERQLSGRQEQPLATGVVDDLVFIKWLSTAKFGMLEKG